MPIKKKRKVRRKKVERPKVSKELKLEMTAKANDLINEYSSRWKNEYCQNGNAVGIGDIHDIYLKWQGNILYFCLKIPFKSSIVMNEYFEERFIKIKYIGNDQFNLAHYTIQQNFVCIVKVKLIRMCKISDVVVLAYKLIFFRMLVNR